MWSVSRYCRPSSILPQIKQIVGCPYQNFARNGLLRTYATTVLKRQTLCNSSKVTNFLRGSGTIAVRLTSDVSDKGKKAVGYWLLTCGGMVFVAVILGIVAVYCVVLISICVVLREVIKRTVR